MHAVPLTIESAIWGRKVLALEDCLPGDDFAAVETEYLRAFQPVYVSCKVPLACYHVIHALECWGFHFIECQFRCALKIPARDLLAAFPYRFEEVKTPEALQTVLEIAGETFTADRYSIDTQLPAHLSGERYRQYVMQSYAAQDEGVYRLLDPDSGETVAFKTHRYLANGEVLLLLGGVHPGYKSLGLGPVNAAAEVRLLREKGYRKAFTHISAANAPVINLDIGFVGFKVVEASVVLRKIYP